MKFGNAKWDKESSKKWNKELIGISNNDKEPSPTLQDEKSRVEEISEKKSLIERITRKRGTRETYRQDLLKKAQQEEAEGYIKVYSSFLDRFLQANLSNASGRILLAAYAELRNKGTDSIEMSYDTLKKKTGLDRKEINKGIDGIPPSLLKIKRATSKNTPTVFFKYDGPFDYFFKVPRNAFPILVGLTSIVEISLSLFTFSYYGQGFAPDSSLLIALTARGYCEIAKVLGVSVSGIEKLLSKPLALIQSTKVGRGQYELTLKQFEDMNLDIGQNPTKVGQNPTKVGQNPTEYKVGQNPTKVGQNPTKVGQNPTEYKVGQNPTKVGQKPNNVGQNPTKPFLENQSSQVPHFPNVASEKNDQNFEAPKNELESSRISYKKRERDAFQNFCNLPENIGRVGNQWPALFEYATRELEARGLSVELAAEVLAETLAHGKEGAKLKSERPIFSPLSYWPSEKGAGFNFFLNKVLEKGKKAKEQEAAQAAAYGQHCTTEPLKDILTSLFPDAFALCTFAISVEIWPKDQGCSAYLDFFEVITKRTLRLAEQNRTSPTQFLQSKLEAFERQGGFSL